jgi:hypothetical protein
MTAYRLKKERAFRVGNIVFECKTGRIVTVRQVDKENRKVLIQFSSDCLDWFHESVLNDFELKA